ncbi:MAG TPA: hypothetical protein VF335_00810, partial [Chitinivibrionales bacterium]
TDEREFDACFGVAFFLLGRSLRKAQGKGNKKKEQYGFKEITRFHRFPIVMAFWGKVLILKLVFFFAPKRRMILLFELLQILQQLNQDSIHPLLAC